MPGEVDRLLHCMRRVERLELELEKPWPIDTGLLWGQLESARKTEQAAFTALLSAAHRGDPEALVALEALKAEIEEKTWMTPRSAA
jgi:hypothetical protein